MNKPETIPFFKFYIVKPVKAIIRAIRDAAVNAHRMLSGAWYCEYCQKYHGRRVCKYKYNKYEHGMWSIAYRCSLGEEAARNQKAKVGPYGSLLGEAIAQASITLKQAGDAMNVAISAASDTIRRQ